MQRVLVTGATGFIGRRLVLKLEEAGIQVVALVRDPGAGIGAYSLPWQAPAIVPDISECGKIDAVIHLAGKAHAVAENSRDEGEYFRINTEGTRQLLEAASAIGVRRFVLFSSVKAMGEGGEACLDESASCQPDSPYGASKLEAERLVLEGGYVPEPVALRLSMVYGDSEKGNLPRMIQAIAKGRFPPLPEVGNKRSMVHADDVVRAAMLAAARPEAIGQAYIVTDGTPYSTRQIYEWICEVLGKPVPGWNLPMPLFRTLARMGDGIGRLRGRRFMFDSDALDKLIGSAWYSSAKLERELGFHPERHLRESLEGIIRFLGVRRA